MCQEVWWLYAFGKSWFLFKCDLELNIYSHAYGLESELNKCVVDVIYWWYAIIEPCIVMDIWVPTINMWPVLVHCRLSSNWNKIWILWPQPLCGLFTVTFSFFQNTSWEVPMPSWLVSVSLCSVNHINKNIALSFYSFNIVHNPFRFLFYMVSLS